MILLTVSRTGKLTKRAQFLKQDGFKKGPNGTKMPNYVEVMRPWFGYKQKYLTEVKSEDTSYKNTVNIVIRQKQKQTVTPDMIVSIKGVQYNIVDINPDVENEDFMLLILKAVE